MAYRSSDRDVRDPAFYRAARRGLITAAALLLGSGAFAADGPLRPKKAPPATGDYVQVGTEAYPVQIDRARLSLRFAADATPDQVRSWLASRAEVRAELLAGSWVSEQNRVLAPLKEGLSEADVTELARTWNAMPDLVYAMPVVIRQGETLGLTNRYTVAFKKGVAEIDAKASILARGDTVVRRHPYLAHGYLVEIPAASTRTPLRESVRWFEAGQCDFATPEFVLDYRRYEVPNDALFGNQWHLRSLGQFGAAVDADVDATEAFDIEHGDPSVIIAILDDGVELQHPDLAPNLVQGYDFLAGDANPSPSLQGDNHGTACAGVAAARGFNGIGVSGAAPGCRILPVRMLGSGMTTTGTADAFYFSANSGAAVISNSWGPFYSGQFNPMWPEVSAAVQYAVTKGRGGKGCVVLFAAGNDYGSADLNGNSTHPSTISVAASTDQDIHSPYSNAGSSVDICAPSNGGVNGITTTDRLGAAGYNSASDYANDFGGTSSACPLVAGVAALVLSKNPSLTWTQVADILRGTADKIDPWSGTYNSAGHSPYYGYGKVNAHQAVLAAANAGGGDPGGGGEGFTTFHSAQVPVAIPDADTTQGASSSLTVTGMTGNLLDLNVTVGITHPYAGDIQLFLQRPDGAYIQLKHSDGGDSSQNVFTTFDTLTASIEPMSNLAGKSPNGSWILWAYDVYTGDTGAITQWSLDLKAESTGGDPGDGDISQYESAHAPLKIPDGKGSKKSEIYVQGNGGAVKSIGWSVLVDHPTLTQLDVTLKHAGAKVKLVKKGQVAPASVLAAFEGLPADGSWLLTVQDKKKGKKGKLVEWSLEIETW